MCTSLSMGQGHAGVNSGVDRCFVPVGRDGGADPVAGQAELNGDVAGHEVDGGRSIGWPRACLRHCPCPRPRLLWNHLLCVAVQGRACFGQLSSGGGWVVSSCPHKSMRLGVTAALPRSIKIALFFGTALSLVRG